MAKKSSISRQMELMLAALAAIVALSSIALTASAQDVEAQKAAALNDIRETADDICYTVQQQGTQTTIKLSGDIQAKADGLIKKLVSLGFSVSGEQNSSTYQGVLREQLAQTLTHSIDCKKDVFDKLVSLMLPAKAVSTPVPTPTSFLTLEQLFDTDFPYANIGRALPLKPLSYKSADVIIKSRLFLDFDARSEFLSLYIPYQTDANLAFIMAGGMASHVAEIVDPTSDINKQMEVESSLLRPGESAATPISELHFSGRVYIYLENDLTDAQKATIEEQYTSRNMAPEIRASDWEALHANDKRPSPLTHHLPTTVNLVTYTTPSAQALAEGDKITFEVQVLPTPTTVKLSTP